MTTYVFPGQGSQKRGMGEGLFEVFPDLVTRADEILGYSIKELCVRDPNDVLRQTQFTQPAIFVVNALSYLKRLRDGAARPAYVAGHSLGEFSALFAAGALDFESGLRLVKKRGALMAEARDGGMASVVGLTEARVASLLIEQGLGRLDLANLNSPTQIVISGLKSDVEAAKPIFEAAGAQMFIPLNVGGAFHSRYMVSAGEQFARFLETIEFKPFDLPVISNVEARPYTQARAKQLLAAQLTHPVRWTDTIRYLMGRGETEFVEIGPGNVLTGLTRRIQREAKPLVLDEDEVGAVAPPQPAPIAAAPVNAPDGVAPSPAQPHARSPLGMITASTLGGAAFRKAYGVKYAYVAGGMVRGIASRQMVVRMGRAGLLSFFGTGGLDIEAIERAIVGIRSELADGQPFGMNLLCNYYAPAVEEATVDLLLRHGVRNVEAAAYVSITPALARYRIKGLQRRPDGGVEMRNRVLGKVSRPEVAEAFLSPVPDRLIRKLLEAGRITLAEAELAARVPVADDLCVEADSGGHTDQGVLCVLLPAMRNLNDDQMRRHGYETRVRVGAAGGIGTPEAAAAAFVLGADFVLTGSINQCTVEAGTSDAVKDLLEQADVQDTAYAPAGDMFEIGARIQVLKKGLFFPARANKLYELYRRYDSLADIDETTRNQLEQRYFKKSLEEAYAETKAYFQKVAPEEIERAERDPKHKMGLTFRWYYGYSSRLALEGSQESRVDYQVYCGPALGAFNRWVKNTPLQSWRQRHVDEIAEKLMIETAALLERRFLALRMSEG